MSLGRIHGKMTYEDFAKAFGMLSDERTLAELPPFFASDLEGYLKQQGWRKTRLRDPRTGIRSGSGYLHVNGWKSPQKLAVTLASKGFPNTQADNTNTPVDDSYAWTPDAWSS